MSFDKLSVGDRDNLAFRDKNPYQTLRAVIVENGISEPIPVTIISEAISNGIILSIFGAIVALGSGSETLIISYTVPAAKTAKLLRTEFSGTNISTYNLYLNTVLISTIRTHHGSGLSDDMLFSGGTADGLPLIAGDLLELKTIHARPTSADFDGRIQVVEIS
jgi:hypothetical protein